MNRDVLRHTNTQILELRMREGGDVIPLLPSTEEARTQSVQGRDQLPRLLEEVCVRVHEYVEVPHQGRRVASRQAWSDLPELFITSSAVSVRMRDNDRSTIRNKEIFTASLRRYIRPEINLVNISAVPNPDI